MNELSYEFQIELNWLGDRKESDLQSLFSRLRNQHGQQLIRTKVFEGLPRRLWEKILKHLKMNETMQWAQLPKKMEDRVNSGTHFSQVSSIWKNNE